MTPNDTLLEAARSGDIGALRAALAQGANRVVLNAAKSIAIEHGHGLAVEYLLEHGAELQQNDLFLISLLGDEEAACEVARAVLRAGGDINRSFDGHPRTALHAAVVADKPVLAKFLLENGADIRPGTEHAAELMRLTSPKSELRAILLDAMESEAAGSP
ncbi:MAG: hypothetical protein RLY93_17720 [Sumerlaeia bacterium]